MRDQHLTFRGRVLPEGYGLSIGHTPALTRDAHDNTPEATFLVVVADGKVLIRVAVESYSDRIVSELFVPAIDFAQTLVDIVGFAEGVAYHVIIDEFVDPNGKVKPLALAERRLSGLCTAYSSSDVSEIADFVLTQPALAHVFRDVMMMLTKTHYAPISAGRVIDSLVRHMTGGKGAAEWAEFRQNLNLSERYLKLMTTTSAGPRHGDRLFVPGDVVFDLSVRAWTVFNRYLHFLKNEKRALDADAFPTLTGNEHAP